MPFMPTDCALAIGTLFHALPAVQPDSVIAGMPASVFGNVVSGVVGSVITLGGVLLSNWHGRGLKREELKHDATQRNHEREMMLRREVFLPAVEAALTMLRSALWSILRSLLSSLQKNTRRGTLPSLRWPQLEHRKRCLPARH
jgi:hypothetical protein